MKDEEISNVKFAWQAINFALPMIWLLAVSLWGILWRVL